MKIEHIAVKIYLFDTTKTHANLLPLSFTRPVADFRCGIMTIMEKWQHMMPGEYGYCPVHYLQDKYGSVNSCQEEAIFIAGNLLPREDLCDLIQGMQSGDALVSDNEILIYKGNISFNEKELEFPQLESLRKVTYTGNIELIQYVYDIFLHNGEEIKLDYKRLTAGRKSKEIPMCVRMLCGRGETEEFTDAIFIEEGAVVECASINTKEGPVYIGKDAVLMEGACIRGPFALCEGGEVRMGAKIYKATTIGPHCKVGGEVSNTVFFGYSNKSHDGYLGNAVIGEWCNIGAGVNASNLKNDYSLIRVWNYASQRFMKTDLQFCGLIMGDHSKIGVNCMINSATVIGVGVNLHGAGFPRAFVPCFCEGSPGSGFTKVPLKKFLDTAERVMSRRDQHPSEADEQLLEYIYDNHEK